MKKSISTLILLPFATLAFAQWTTGGTLLSDTTANHHHIIVSVSAEGGAFVTWMGTDTGNINKIYLTGMDESGNLLPTWPSGGKVVSQAGNWYAPVVAASEDSGAIVSWYGIPASGTIYHVYAQKYSRKGMPLWNGGNPIMLPDTGADSYRYPIIVSDKHNGFYLTWTRYDSLNSSSSLDIYLCHIDSTGSVAAGWSHAGTPVAVTPDVREYYPRLVLSKDQTSVYVMYTVGPIAGASVILKKYNASDGAVAGGWTSDGITLTTGPNVYTGVMYEQWLFCDDQNNIVAFWLEARYTPFGEVYMQRVKPDGSILLFSGGRQVHGALTPNGVSYHEVTPSSDGNYLLTDNYYNNDLSTDIDAMKISIYGTIIWQKSPMTSNHATGYPKPASDGHNGMYVFYKSFYSPGKLYAIALDSLGNNYNNWTLPGTDFGNLGTYDSYNQYYDFDVITAKPGYAIVAWDRQDGSQYNVYACNLLPDGTHCAPPVFSTNEIRNEAGAEVYPNPFTSDIYIDKLSRTDELIFKLFNLNGKLLIIKNLTSSSISIIHTGDLSNGIYFYSLANRQSLVKKGILIKQ